MGDTAKMGLKEILISTVFLLVAATVSEGGKLLQENRKVTLPQLSKRELKRSWLSHEWNKHKDALVDGALGALAAAGTAAALGKRSDDAQVERELKRSWLSHELDKHKEAITGGILSGAATALLGKRYASYKHGDMKRSWLSHGLDHLKEEVHKHTDDIIEAAVSTGVAYALGKRMSEEMVVQEYTKYS